MGWDAGGCHCPDNTCCWLLGGGRRATSAETGTVFKSSWDWDIEMTTQFVPTIFV